MNRPIFLISLAIFIICIPHIVLAAEESYPGIEVTFRDEMIIATPGNQGQVILNLISVGSGTVEGIKITATSSNWGIKSEGDWDRRIGDLYSGHSTSILFNFQVSSSATPGLYEIKFEVTTTNAGSITGYAVVKIEEPNILDIVSVTPSSIDIGEATTLVFNISNNGGSSIGDILFTWEDTSDLILPIGSDNRITIPSIPEGNYTEIPINVMASSSANPAVYPLTITMEYYDTTGMKQTVTSTVGVQVGGSTDFEIVQQESTSFGTTFAVANTGANAASSVIVSIPNKLSYQISGTSSVSLGNLDAGDYTLVTFQISSIDKDEYSQWPDKSSTKKSSDFNYSKLNNLKSGTNDLIVEVSYTDVFGVRHTIEKEVDLSSLSSIGKSDFSSKTDFSGKDNSNDKSSGLDNGTIYIIIGIAGIIAIITILQVSKRKKK